LDIVIPNPSSIGVFSVAAILLLLAPGPAVLYIVARSVEQGRIAGLASVCGITTGTLVHVLAAYIGARRIRSRSDIPSAQTELPRRSLARLYRDGFVVNLLNPKTALFFLAFLPQFVDPSRGAVAFQIAFLGVLFTLMGLTNDALYALVAGAAGRWVKCNGRCVGNVTSPVACLSASV
jgi:threonine/homoserine/homoserine lactone efflux protein